MAILHLTLKKKWFDMIASGEKKEEYREVKMYWWKRLVQCGQCFNNESELLPVAEWKMLMQRNYDFIKFTNGYAKNAPTITLECKGIEIGKAVPEWSDNWQGEVFIIKLGNIV